MASSLNRGNFVLPPATGFAMLMLWGCEQSPVEQQQPPAGVSVMTVMTLQQWGNAVKERSVRPLSD